MEWHLEHQIECALERRPRKLALNYISMQLQMVAMRDILSRHGINIMTTPEWSEIISDMCAIGEEFDRMYLEEIGE